MALLSLTRRNSAIDFLSGIFPGVVLAAGVSALAYAVEYAEVKLTGQAALENLVLAILIGTLVRSFLPLSDRFHQGIRFSAKILLEIAIVLLGASISLHSLAVTGAPLVIGILVVVALAICTSYGIGRVLGLEHKLSLLVACGNSICGNSAIAAAAPVLRAKAEDVAAAIAFTAVLGVVLVLLLPLAIPGFSLEAGEYGVLSGMTVYAVPQVLAAAQPGGVAAIQIGTLVKLVRVMTLGPVLFILGLIMAREAAHQDEDGDMSGHHGGIRWRQVMPWFIIGFAAMLFLRSFAVINEPMAHELSKVSGFLTVISMAALGLEVDIRSLSQASGRVVLAAGLSICALTGFSLALIWLVIA